MTNHITNIIKYDSLNYDLGLTITGNIENQSNQFMMSKIKKDKVYRISNPSLPVSDSKSPIKTIILFNFVGLILSFIFILIRYFYNLKLIDKKYK